LQLLGHAFDLYTSIYWGLGTSVQEDRREAGWGKGKVVDESELGVCSVEGGLT
jgi:hypothetical protein